MLLVKIIKLYEWNLIISANVLSSLYFWGLQFQLFFDLLWRAPKLLIRLKWESKVKTMEELKIGARSLACNIIRGGKGMLELRDGIRKSDKHLFTHMDLQKTK